MAHYLWKYRILWPLEPSGGSWVKMAYKNKIYLFQYIKSIYPDEEALELVGKMQEYFICVTCIPQLERALVPGSSLAARAGLQGADVQGTCRTFWAH
jgi:hypothetical protein